jgi:SAM-dependent methyltransferase
MSHPPINWEDPPCDVCKAITVETIFSGPDRLERLPGTFFMARCTGCGVYRQLPRPVWASLQHYYPEDYVAYQYNQPQKSLKGFIQGYGNIKRRRAIEKFQPGGHLLEVGCGTGNFLRELQTTNRWTCEGIEPSQSAADYARNTLQIPIHHGLFSDFSFEPESFDVVMMGCVLEHLQNPVRDIQRTYDLLKKGGWFVFTIPNFESLERKIFREYWSGWDLPRHLYVFPKPVLQRVMEENGFWLVERKCLASSYHVLRHSFDFWSQTWEEKHPVAKKWLMQAYASWFTRLGLMVPLAILDRLNLSTNITVFAQKIQKGEPL